MTVVEMLEKDSGKELVVCWQCSLANRSGRLNKMGIEHRKSHRARDTRQDRADRFRRWLKELRAEQANLGESYKRMPPKLLPRFGQILWDLQILAERAIRFFRGIRTKPRAFTALQRVKASIGR